MPRFDFGGAVNNTNATTGPWPGTNFVYTDWGGGFPDGNLDYIGRRPIRVGNMGHYVYSGGGVRSLILYRGVLSAGWYTWDESGGGWQTRIEYTSGALNFGRNTGNGGYTNDSRGGGWSGGLCGFVDWYATPLTPGNQSLTRNGRNLHFSFREGPSNGGLPVTNYVCQLNDGSGWGYEVHGEMDGEMDWTGLTPGKTYQARVLAQNDVGNSPWQYTNSVYIPPAGKRMTGDGTSVAMSIGRRMTGASSYVEQTVGKRFNGSSWVDFA